MKININLAKSYIGTPYVWGGESAREGGFDCSGYVFNVLNGSGIVAGRLTAQGYFNLYRKYEVAKSEKKIEGDLLFFGKSKNKITHVAIAVNSTDMIESVGKSTNTINNKGKGVCINKITRRKDLVAVVRFVENVSRETLIIPSATPNLKIGSKGMEVERLQTFLNVKFNAGLKVDGLFGNATRTALRKVQSASGLVADGIYGTHTKQVFTSLVR